MQRTSRLEMRTTDDRKRLMAIVAEAQGISLTELVDRAVDDYINRFMGEDEDVSMGRTGLATR